MKFYLFKKVTETNKVLVFFIDSCLVRNVIEHLHLNDFQHHPIKEDLAQQSDLNVDLQDRSKTHSLNRYRTNRSTKKITASDCL